MQAASIAAVDRVPNYFTRGLPVRRGLQDAAQAGFRFPGLLTVRQTETNIRHRYIFLRPALASWESRLSRLRIPPWIPPVAQGLDCPACPPISDPRHALGSLVQLSLIQPYAAVFSAELISCL